MYRKNNIRLFINRAHKKSLFRNMCKSLISHNILITTVVKAKNIKSIIEKLITLGKKNSLNTRRRLISKLGPKSLREVNIILNTLSPIYKSREGGYTRILKAGYRKGDCAPMTIIQFVS